MPSPVYPGLHWHLKLLEGQTSAASGAQAASGWQVPGTSGVQFLGSGMASTHNGELQCYCPRGNWLSSWIFEDHLTSPRFYSSHESRDKHSVCLGGATSPCKPTTATIRLLLRQKAATYASTSKWSSIIVQGSGIGPCVFIVYIMDLKPISSFNTILKYADDTTLLVPQNCSITLQAEFSRIRQ